MKKFFRSLKVGVYLGLKQIRRASKWTTLLITMVMTLTFLNLVFVSGILVGLIQGSIDEYKEQYSGDVILTTLPTKNYITESQRIVSFTESLDEVEALSARYIEGATLEANYKTKSRASDKADSVGVNVVGIDPDKENELGDLSSALLKGEYLRKGDESGIIIGHYLLSQYSNVDFPGQGTLDDVEVGDKIRLIVGDIRKEMTVRGIVKSKVDEVSIRAFVNDSLLRKIIQRDDYNVDEIAIRISDPEEAQQVKQTLINADFDKNAIIQTSNESLGDFLEDIINTFSMLGAFFGSIGLVVASITIFIVVFINAITRRKYIGIMKGIGISSLAIEISYVIQSLIYAIVGSALGAVIVYRFAIPFFERNPINFPFSDGILVAPVDETVIKVALIILATIIAGYLPAKMVSRENTLNAILGR